MEIWESKLPGTLWATPGLYRDSFTFFYDYYISNEGLMEECDREESVAVTGAAATSCLKQKIVKCVFRCLVFAQSPPGRHPSDKCSSHRSLAVLLGKM